ncbi:putative disease resistance RPP13-like protein 3 [Abeliophyllum distichum]|uniref:Disease resistance RPP13-like protein 3 n=1 Tax=Abeliophyllum distichum TaxID=126358 RepID=A0ABD1RVB8_9LAMI
MRNLTLDESWNLLHEMVFGAERYPPELKDIGKMILMECRGLPLLLVLIGGLLYKSERTLHYWKHVESNIRSGVLREDYEIRRSKLTKLWVANRFIKPDRSKSFEEVAEEYLKDLVDRNLILVREWSYRREIKTYGIHDILRDFCLMKVDES